MLGFILTNLPLRVRSGGHRVLYQGPGLARGSIRLPKGRRPVALPHALFTTIRSNEVELDASYDQFEEIIHNEKSLYKFVVGDFNTKLGEAQECDEGSFQNKLSEEARGLTRTPHISKGCERISTGYQPSGPERHANLFDSTVLPALCYGTETCVTSACTSRALSTSHRALERCILRFNRVTQYRAGLRSSDMRRMSRFRDPVEYTKNAKFRWTGHIMRRDDDRWTRRTVE
uniref:Endo/exonuclease/phosphatase domain-containing protein n=1 Tax=Haemonchus placei TaxID=6290 RepID=A0A158QMC4_HAEPC